MEEGQRFFCQILLKRYKILLDRIKMMYHPTEEQMRTLEETILNIDYIQ